MMNPSDPELHGLSEQGSKMSAAGMPSSRRMPEEKLIALAGLVSNEAAFTAFKKAAFNDDLWQQAEADPRTYFMNLGIEIPEILDINL